MTINNYSPAVVEYIAKGGVIKVCKPQGYIKALTYNYGKTASSKSFSKWTQAKSTTLKNAGYAKGRM
jgi:hypothetical protein